MDTLRITPSRKALHNVNGDEMLLSVINAAELQARNCPKIREHMALLQYQQTGPQAFSR